MPEGRGYTPAEEVKIGEIAKQIMRAQPGTPPAQARKEAITRMLGQKGKVPQSARTLGLQADNPESRIVKPTDVVDPGGAKPHAAKGGKVKPSAKKAKPVKAGLGGFLGRVREELSNVAPSPTFRPGPIPLPIRTPPSVAPPLPIFRPGVPPLGGFKTSSQPGLIATPPPVAPIPPPPVGDDTRLNVLPGGGFFDRPLTRDLGIFGGKPGVPLPIKPPPSIGRLPPSFTISGGKPGTDQAQPAGATRPTGSIDPTLIQSLPSPGSLLPLIQGTASGTGGQFQNILQNILQRARSGDPQAQSALRGFSSMFSSQGGGVRAAGGGKLRAAGGGSMSPEEAIGQGGTSPEEAIDQGPPVSVPGGNITFGNPYGPPPPVSVPGGNISIGNPYSPPPSHPEEDPSFVNTTEGPLEGGIEGLAAQFGITPEQMTQLIDLFRERFRPGSATEEEAASTQSIFDQIISDLPQSTPNAVLEFQARNAAGAGAAT